MAEAHAAVAFSFSITHEGWDVNFDREVLHLVWASGIRSWKKRFFRFLNNLRSGVYPASLQSLWLTIAVVTAIHFAGYKVPYDLVGKTAPYLSGSWILAHLAGSFVVGLVLWMVVIYAIRYTLKLLLIYKGWMYESREKGSTVSRGTRIWTWLVKLLLGWHKPMLYSFQGSLPRLPLPSVKDTMARILIQGLVPLCSWQYERVFNTTRVPGRETDKIVHYQDSKHVVVYHKGRYFKVLIYHKNRILQPCEIQVQMQQILDDKSEPSDGEVKLAALTAGERTAWANARETYFAKGVNKASLDLIERAAFVVVLDDIPYIYDPDDPEKLDQYGRILLHGKGYDRWFDKSFTLCIGSNGRTGFNAEHSWADAAVMSHLWEYVMAEEIVDREFTKDGHTKGAPEFTPPPPTRLQWDLDVNCISAIQQSYQVAQTLLNDVELRIYVHDAYGKGFMKTNSMSPDAYIQLALQLAYHRDSNKFNLTYEASMTRLFREGRTETVRPCTIESTAWVKAMEDKEATVDHKYKLLLAAAKQHQKAYQDAMCGKGIDRHLFCLYVVSKYLEVDSPFLKEVLSEPWKLSTSQTPHGQTSLIDLKKHPNCISAGGGFGPVADDGYGVSYIIAGENLLFFHISCKRTSPETNAARFANRIEKALADLKLLFLERKKLQAQKNGAM
ncbi:carnitine O-palmitoyltransferase 1, liver isoform isoform X3 [Colletes gigas]|uniref:carnitine O-palmitoyltransferase 1, liver isoform isoform X3 n=1 Tax=Colletes gigas TaxID=935657 RepID=UPI001C9B5015|nr:carnitine O-palmitoyltransferase 1, liver isoform isoform X3 [Colletes gigas]